MLAFNAESITKIVVQRKATKRIVNCSTCQLEIVASSLFPIASDFAQRFTGIAYFAVADGDNWEY